MKRLILLAGLSVCLPALAARPFEIVAEYLPHVNAAAILASRTYIDTSEFTDEVLGDVDIDCAGAGFQPPDIRCLGTASRADLEVLGVEVIGYTPHTGDATLVLSVTADGEAGYISIEPNPSP